MNTTASNAHLHKMVGCALFAALTAVCSQLAIPMPWGVPINLALFAVYMAGTMLGPVWGAASQLVYLLLAAVGVPVMAGMQGGPTVLLGKTGGYAIGYLLAALIAGAFAAKLPRKFGWLALGCVVGCAACYVLGTIWFMVLTGLDLPTSLTYCVIPYLPGDVIKIALASRPSSWTSACRRSELIFSHVFCAPLTDKGVRFFCCLPAALYCTHFLHMV